MSELSPEDQEVVIESPAFQWLSSLHSSHQLDAALGDFNPFDTLFNSVVEGHAVSEQLHAESALDPNVQLKNRFLGLLATLSDNDGYHVSDMLGLMEHQALVINPPDETRFRQFMGLWDFAVALSRNEELLEELQSQQITISSEDEYYPE